MDFVIPKVSIFLNQQSSICVWKLCIDSIRENKWRRTKINEKVKIFLFFLDLLFCNTSGFIMVHGWLMNWNHYLRKEAFLECWLLKIRLIVRLMVELLYIIIVCIITLLLYMLYIGSCHIKWSNLCSSNIRASRSLLLDFGFLFLLSKV